jgi:hypothetical protein
MEQFTVFSYPHSHILRVGIAIAELAFSGKNNIAIALEKKKTGKRQTVLA